MSLTKDDLLAVANYPGHLTCSDASFWVPVLPSGEIGWSERGHADDRRKAVEWAP